MSYCPKCGKQLTSASETLGICSTCGPVTPTSKPTPAVEVPCSTRSCSNCGRAVTSDARFCEFCGTSIESVPPLPKPISSLASPSGRTKISGKIPLKLLAVALIALIVGFGIGASSFRTSSGPEYVTITKTSVMTALARTTTLTRTVVATSNYIPPAQGENSRLNPVPMGQKVALQTKEGGYPIELWVISAERDAYTKIKQMNMFNSKPNSGKEAILVMIGVKFGGPPTEKLSITVWWFSVVGEKGIVYPCRIDALEPDLIQEVFGGATIEGYVSFDVAQGEQNLVLMVGDTPSYMAISEYSHKSTSTKSSVQTTGQGQWKTIKTLTGSDNRDTEDFNVPTNYWRIVYTIKAENEQYAMFYCYVYPSGETSRYVASVQLSKSGNETSYVREGPGDFYISVLAANLNSWTIEVQIQQ